jgi:SAM-dependent methyltransferase
MRSAQITNPAGYWDGVAGIKTFTHPLRPGFFAPFAGRESRVVDFGCGYGRVVKQLLDLGYTHVTGYDTSAAMIARGQGTDQLPIFHIATAEDLPVEDHNVDAFLLFAVLTCIPSNGEQQALINLLHTKLKKGGIVYISDYYLQEESHEVSRYEHLDGDSHNFGVFTLPDGAVFRHHTTDWISTLLRPFTTLAQQSIPVTTMNGHPATGFQLIAQK